MLAHILEQVQRGIDWIEFISFVTKPNFDPVFLYVTFRWNGNINRDVLEQIQSFFAFYHDTGKGSTWLLT